MRVIGKGTVRQGTATNSECSVIVTGRYFGPLAYLRSSAPCWCMALKRRQQSVTRVFAGLIYALFTHVAADAFQVLDAAGPISASSCASRLCVRLF
jgi:hypothetical protein